MKNRNDTSCNAALAETLRVCDARPVALRAGIFTTMLLALALSALCATPNAFGVVPPPDGGYPGFTTAEGINALQNLTTGSANTAVGWFSLFSNTDGSFNTATGAGALLFNTGANNTATGAAALLFNSDGQNNTGVGAAALENNTLGDRNTANGAFALFSNTEGHSNTAVGYQALFSNIGSISGSGNTAIGDQALFSNTAASGNTAIGFGALFSSVDADNTAVGAGALSGATGLGNIAIGAFAGNQVTTGDHNIYIGNQGVNGDSATIRIGTNGTHLSTFIAGISTNTVSGGNADFVTVDLNTGLIGHLSSSRRYKEEIRPMDNASEALYRLKPVTYRYKKEIDRKQVLDYGLIAEDVDQIDPNLVIYNKDGEIETVRYNAINAMLLNEFLKEHKKVEEQESTITHLKKDFQLTSAQQQNEIQLLTTQLKEQAAQIQKVSAQVEMSKPATKVVLNNP